MLPISNSPRNINPLRKWSGFLSIGFVIVVGTIYFIACCFITPMSNDTSSGHIFKKFNHAPSSDTPLPVANLSKTDHLQSKNLTSELRGYYDELAKKDDRSQPPYFIDESNFPIYPIIDCSGRENSEECLRQTRLTPRAPSTREELGHGTWNFLHRMAAQYDKDPTPERQEDMRMFFKLFGDFYPCPDCSAHFREMLKEHPVDVSNNWNLSIWLCEVHNIVNDRLEKPQFPCDIESIRTKWGSCGCLDAPT